MPGLSKMPDSVNGLQPFRATEIGGGFSPAGHSAVKVKFKWFFVRIIKRQAEIHPLAALCFI
jgi:hypothetical protein